jgi:hypothetical protein
VAYFIYLKLLNNLLFQKGSTHLIFYFSGFSKAGKKKNGLFLLNEKSNAAAKEILLCLWNRMKFFFSLFLTRKKKKGLLWF